MKKDAKTSAVSEILRYIIGIASASGGFFFVGACMQKSLSMAGALLKGFREARRRLAAIYGVDESVALEAALRDDARADEGRVD